MAALIKWFVTAERLSCRKPSPYIPMRYTRWVYQSGFSSAGWLTLPEELDPLIEKCQ